MRVHACASRAAAFRHGRRWEGGLRPATRPCADLDDCEDGGADQRWRSEPDVDAGVDLLLLQGRHPAVLDCEEHKVVGASRHATHEEVVEVHQRPHLSGDEQRRTHHDHQDVMEPVDPLQVGEEAHVVDVHGEDEGGGPVIDLCLCQRFDRVRANVEQVGEAQDRDPPVCDDVDCKPARLGVAGVQEVANPERSEPYEAGCGRAPGHLHHRPAHAKDSSECEYLRRHVLSPLHLRQMAIKGADDHVRKEPGERQARDRHGVQHRPAVRIVRHGSDRRTGRRRGHHRGRVQLDDNRGQTSIAW